MPASLRCESGAWAFPKTVWPFFCGPEAERGALLRVNPFGDLRSDAPRSGHSFTRAATGSFSRIAAQHQHGDPSEFLAQRGYGLHKVQRTRQAQVDIHLARLVFMLASGCGGEFSRIIQNSKHQAPTSRESSMLKLQKIQHPLSPGRLGLGISLELGCWDLGLFIAPALPQQASRRAVL